MFFDSDSSSGVSGDLDSATTVAALMEGYWGMGKTVSSAASARRLEAGTPGGQRAAAPGVSQDPHGSPAFARLADRIEENLGVLLVRAEEILRDNERDVLALAHALETHKTLSGEDVTAVLAGGHGPLVDGSVYADDAFIARLRDYHLAAKRAHQEHSQPQIPMPSPVPAYVVTIPETYLNANGTGNDTGTEAGETIGFGGFGAENSNGNGSYTGPLGAPTYDPPGTNGPDDRDEDDHS
jgi:hypothetical protein